MLDKGKNTVNNNGFQTVNKKQPPPKNQTKDKNKSNLNRFSPLLVEVENPFREAVEEVEEEKNPQPSQDNSDDIEDPSFLTP